MYRRNFPIILWKLCILPWNHCKLSIPVDSLFNVLGNLAGFSDSAGPQPVEVADAPLPTVCGRTDAFLSDQKFYFTFLQY